MVELLKVLGAFGWLAFNTLVSELLWEVVDEDTKVGCVSDCVSLTVFNDLLVELNVLLDRRGIPISYFSLYLLGLFG